MLPILIISLLYQVRIHKILEKTRQSKANKDAKMGGEEHEGVTEGKEKLQKKVANLIKKQNLRAVRRIVGGQDAFKPWGQDAKAKVRL